jgi:hypothetical protein
MRSGRSYPPPSPPRLGDLLLRRFIAAPEQRLSALGA